MSLFPGFANFSTGEEGVHAAPVFDPKTHKWVGLIDLKDFVKYILQLEQLKGLKYAYHKVNQLLAFLNLFLISLRFVTIRGKLVKL